MDHKEAPLNKAPVAVALTYDKERPPYVSASGKGLVAEEIIRIAKEHDVLVHEDAALVESLALLDLGDQIPEALYRAIAEVISFAYSLRESVEGEPSLFPNMNMAPSFGASKTTTKTTTRTTTKKDT